jgi:hypothetical protein
LVGKKIGNATALSRRIRAEILKVRYFGCASFNEEFSGLQSALSAFFSSFFFLLVHVQHNKVGRCISMITE